MLLTSSRKISSAKATSSPRLRADPPPNVPKKTSIQQRTSLLNTSHISCSDPSPKVTLAESTEEREVS